MNSASAQFVPSRRIGLYEPMQQLDTWGSFKGNSCFETSPSMILDVDSKLENESEDTSHRTNEVSNRCDQEASKPTDKVRRRLAQNREAARKSRLRKKAYVQQLENSKLRLIQIEQEIERSRQQGLGTGGGLSTDLLGYPRNENSGIYAFEMEYGHWVEEQNRQITDLKTALSSGAGDIDLHGFVDTSMRHYLDLFTMKETAAKTDVFYLMSGMWKTSAERFFFWIGGFRPSQFLRVLLPNLQFLEEHQRVDVNSLAQSCQQAEEALSQGMERLHQIVSEDIGTGLLREENYLPHINSAMEKLDSLARFVGQADHLRKETLQQITRILTTHQAAQALLALGEYLQRLRALSSLWASRPQERLPSKY